MSSSDVEPRVIAVIADTFGVDPSTIGRATVADDVDGWDSLAHTVLMMRLQRVLGAEIDEATASGVETVGDLIDALAERTS
jgi:acyl carrier protein